MRRAPEPAAETVEVPFTIADAGTTDLTVDLTFPNPEDYDLELCKMNGSECVPFGAGNKIGRASCRERV